MTPDEAKDAVRLYCRHRWTFEVDDNGTVYVGGTDHAESVAQARKYGNNGPIVRVYE